MLNGCRRAQTLHELRSEKKAAAADRSGQVSNSRRRRNLREICCYWKEYFSPMLN